MRNVYLSRKFCALTITVFAKECPRNVLNTSPRRVNKNSLTWWYVLKISLQDVLKTSWRCLEEVFARRLEDVLKTSWRHLEDVWPRRIYLSWPRRVEDVRLRRVYSSWSRRLEDVFWRWRSKTSSRRLQDVFIKTNVCWDCSRKKVEKSN